MSKPVVTTLNQVQDDKYYRVADLKEILKNLGLTFSIFSIMNAETWKCLDYGCGKRYKEAQPGNVCPAIKANGQVCGSPLSEPIIPSPRTRGGGKGSGHRRYSGEELKKIVAIFKEHR